MEPLRIAHIIGNMGSGGVESVVMNYYRNIDHNKIQFDFFVDKDSTLPQRKEIESLGGRIFLIPPYSKLLEYRKELKKILSENNYKIIHSHINTLSVFPLQVAKSVGISVRIAHSHSTAGKGEFKRNVMKYILRPFSKIYATNYFACTKYAGEWLFGKKTNITIINNAIDIKKFAYDEQIRNDIRKELNLENKFVIGHVGRFMKQKNHSFIIDIFNELHKKDSDAHLLLVGEGSLRNEIKEKVNKLELNKNVTFLEPTKDIHKIYQAMDFFLFPSLYEGLGMVLVEAQISGLPSLSSSVVPIDAKITDSAMFLDLNQPLEKWVELILSKKKHKRESKIKEAEQSGYDIKIEAKELEDKYLKD